MSSFVDVISCLFPWYFVKTGADQQNNNECELRSHYKLKHFSILKEIYHDMFSHEFWTNDRFFCSENSGSTKPSTNVHSTSSHSQFLPKEALSGGAKTFTMAELNRATSNFSISNKIGEGGFGVIYKGTLNDGNIVAIKRGKKVCSHI